MRERGRPPLAHAVPPRLLSALLLGLFLCFKFLPKALVNKVLTLYFVGLVRPPPAPAHGAAAAAAASAAAPPTCAGRGRGGRDRRAVRGHAAAAAPGAAHGAPLPFCPPPFRPPETHPHPRIPAPQLSLGTLALPAWLSEPLDCTASVAELAGALPGLALCAAYALSKPWLANNALGLCFSLQGVELISLGGARTGALLLAGLFVYDVFWVFCTPVMVSVAKNFDAPIKASRAGRAAAFASPLARAHPTPSLCSLASLNR